jgi:hypothetical protein
MFAVGERGSAALVFLSRTWDSAAAWRATARCAASPIVAAFERSAYGCSNRPSRNFWVRIRLAASSIRAWVTRPLCTRSVRSFSKVVY